MSDPTNPVVSRAELSGRLRQLRVQAGQTLEDAADVLEVSAATVSRIETGQRVPRARDVRELARAFGADEAEVERLAGLVQRSRERDGGRSTARSMTITRDSLRTRRQPPGSTSSRSSVFRRCCRRLTTAETI